MILRHLVTIYNLTLGKTSDGIVSRAFTQGSTIEADVQPRSLTQAEVTLFGFKDTQSNAKTMLFPHNTAVCIGARILWNGTYYNVRGVNWFGEHDDALLIPVQGNET